MNPALRRFTDSPVTFAIVVALFCASSGLSIYSGDRIAMTVGSRSSYFIERVSHVLMMGFQLWIYPLYWLSGTFRLFGLHESITSSLVTAAFSAAFLFPLLRLVARHFTRAARTILGLLLFCTIVEVYSFATDMQELRALDASYIGP